MVERTVCILCGSRHTERIEALKVQDIIFLYKRNHRLSIVDEFSGIEEISLERCRDCDLRYFYPLVKGGESFYEKFQEFGWYYESEKSEYDYVQSILKKGNKVLDVGCGKGLFKWKISECDYTGLEFSKAAAADAIKAGVRVLNESVGTHAEKHEGIYDVVCSFQVLEHVTEPGRFIRDCLKCLKHGGILIIVVPSVDSYIGCSINSPLDMPPHHLTRWSDQALKNISVLFGLEQISLWHEPISRKMEYHLARTLYLNLFYNLAGIRVKSIDRSLIKKIFTAFSVVLAIFFPRYFKRHPLGQRGYSAAAVYRKPLLN